MKSPQSTIQFFPLAFSSLRSKMAQWQEGQSIHRRVCDSIRNCECECGDELNRIAPTRGIWHIYLN